MNTYTPTEAPTPEEREKVRRILDANKPGRKP